MKKLTIFFSAFIVFFSVGCQKSGKVSIDPAGNSDWELVTEIEGHHKKASERFELKGSEAIIQYDVKSTKEWTHSNFKLYVAKGNEEQWTNPEVKVFNKNHEKGKKRFRKPAGSYYLEIDPLEVHYHVKVYQRKEVKKDHQSGNGHGSSGGH